MGRGVRQQRSRHQNIQEVWYLSANRWAKDDLISIQGLEEYTVGEDENDDYLEEDEDLFEDMEN